MNTLKVFVLLFVNGLLAFSPRIPDELEHQSNVSLALQNAEERIFHLAPGSQLRSDSGLAKLKVTVVVNGTLPECSNEEFAKVWLYITRSKASHEQRPAPHWSPEMQYIADYSVDENTASVETSSGLKTISLPIGTVSLQDKAETTICGDVRLVWYFDPFATCSDHPGHPTHIVSVPAFVNCTGKKLGRFVEIIPDFMAAGHRSAVLVHERGHLKSALAYLVRRP